MSLVMFFCSSWMIYCSEEGLPPGPSLAPWKRSLPISDWFCDPAAKPITETNTLKS
jgi:hypothetical protein